MMVSVKELFGHSLLMHGNVGETQVVASLDPHLQVEPDVRIHLTVNLDTLHVFDPDTLTRMI